MGRRLRILGRKELLLKLSRKAGVEIPLLTIYLAEEFPRRKTELKSFVLR